MALSWTSSLQDLVALSVLQKAYTDLRAHEKTFLDGTASVPTSAPGGVAGQALNVVGQYAQWFGQAGASAANLPSVWEHVLVAETAWRFSMGIKPSDAAMHRQAVSAAWEAAMDSYSVADASANTLNDQSVHVQMIRFHVIRHCLRRSGKRRLYVPVPDIDNAINWAIDYIWYFGAWNFRTRHCAVTIPLNTITVGGSSGTFVLTYNGSSTGALTYNCTASEIEDEFDTIVGDGLVSVSGSGGAFTMDIDPSVMGVISVQQVTGTCTCTVELSVLPSFAIPFGESYHSFVSQTISLHTPSAVAGRSAKLVSAEDFNRIKTSPSVLTVTPTAAAPRYFWIEHQSNGAKLFRFWPEPDQEYTGYATIAVAAPAYPTTITATTCFDKFPAPMRRLLPDFVLAKIMRQYNLDGWEAAEANAKDQLVKIAPDYDTRGAAEWSDGIGTTDVYQDGYNSSRML